MLESTNEMVYKPKTCNSLWPWFLLLWIFNALILTDCFLWTLQPPQKTDLKRGTNVTLSWDYELEENEKLYSSSLKGNNVEIAQRIAAAKSYIIFREGTDKFLIVSGFSNVSLTIVNVTMSKEYCYHVSIIAKDGADKIQSCTRINLYDTPRIRYHTRDTSIYQGNTIVLYCNASGIPQPTIYWNKKTNRQSLARSSMMKLNITGKESSGNYCCIADNQFANDTACTFLNVTEYQPNNTSMTSSNTYVTRTMTFNVSCISDATPAAIYTFYQNGGKPRNSTDGRYSTTSTTSTQYEQITCVPFNKYGKGPHQSIHIPVYVSPLWRNTTTTNYTMTTMTNNSIIIACEATGNPKPVITWTNKSNRTIKQSRDGYLTVKYEQCNEVILVYYCVASNDIGTTTRKPITVQVNTLNQCMSTIATITDQSKHGMDKLIAITVGVLCLIIMLIVLGLIIVFMKKKKRKKSLMSTDAGKCPRHRQGSEIQEVSLKMVDESPYGDPIDVISPSVNTDCYGDYTTIQDVSRNTGKASVDDENAYASVINSRSPKKKATAPAKVNKDKKSKQDTCDIAMMPLYEEIPGRQTSNTKST